MRSSRAQFKYALRQCKLDERLIVSKELADHMKNHGINDFWKNIRKHSKSKSALSDGIELQEKMLLLICGMIII